MKILLFAVRTVRSEHPEQSNRKRKPRPNTYIIHIYDIYNQIKILKIFESLPIIRVLKSGKTFKMSFWADFGRESEKILTLK